jgi:hypothetical protein
MLSNYKRINILKETEYFADFNLISGLVLDLKKKNPDDDAIADAVSAMARIGLYVNNMIMEQDLVEKHMTTSRSDKNRAITRARTADQRLQEAEKMLKDYKNMYG